MRNLLTTALVLASLASPASAGVRVVDGDTLDIDGERIRIVKIDTPETHRSRCPNEYTLGLKAKDRLTELLSSGEVTFVAEGFDRYGRTLAYIYVGEVDVGQRLLDEGHALPWRPGAKAKAERLAAWCPPTPE